MTSPHLALYYFESCPFCIIVLRVIDKLNIEVEYRDIYSDQSHLNKLMQDTGRRTTPCLYIDGKTMFESSDIMAWLEQHAPNLQKKA